MLKRKWLPLLLILLLYLSFILPQLGKPLIKDEFYFFNSANALNKIGYPEIYDGEQKPVLVAGYHPTLFIHILAFFFKLFGPGETIARFVNVLFSLGTAFLIYITSMEIFRNKPSRNIIATISCFIYLINPLAIQGALLIDMDGGILTFLMLLLVYSFVRTSGKNWLLLCLIQTIALWVKLQSILFLAPLLLFYIFNRKFKEGFVLVSLVGLISVGSFLFTWYIYTLLVPIPFLMPIQHLVNSVALLISARYADMDIFTKAFYYLWAMKTIVFWVTPTFFLPAAAVLYRRTLVFLKTKKLFFLDLIALYGVVILAIFFLLSPSTLGFPKYLTVMMPFFSIVVAYFVADARFKVWNRPASVFSVAVLVLLLFAYDFMVLSDPLIPHNIFYTQSLTLADNFNTYLLNSLYGILYVAPFFIAFLYFLISKKKLFYSFALSSIIVLVVSCFYIDYIQSRADYSTIYVYGQEGMLETADYIKQHTNHDDIILAPQTIAQYADRKYYKSFYFDGGAANFTDVIHKNNIPYLVIAPENKFSGYEDIYIFDVQIGSFKVYHRKAVYS